MKQYICPQCGAKSFIPAPSCPDCGETVAINDYRTGEVACPPMPPEVNCLALTSDLGKELNVRVMPFPTDVGENMLRQISDYSRQAERIQFRLIWRNRKCFIQAIPGTRNATALNGKIITDEAEIHQGDSISICGRKTGQQGMTIIAIYKL